MADRLKQISGHLSGSYPKGLLSGEVVVVTGAFLMNGVADNADVDARV